MYAIIAGIRKGGEMMKSNMLQLFSVGDILYGYCSGFFGRDDYATKTCVFVAPKYAVFEYEKEGWGTILNYDERILSEVAKWKIPPEEEDE
jgi:hypothetical protein